MRKGNKVQVKGTTEMKYGPFLTDNYATGCKHLYHQQLHNYMLPFFLTQLTAKIASVILL